MSDSEKEKYNEKALAKFVGKVMYGYCFCLLLLGLNDLFKTDWLFIIGFVLFIGLTIFVVVYANTRNRFKK
ncbi:DUF3784 domain-containing protein [Lysinibacillus xylanilyticus]|uniref:DUF3784 domain-containing protein n=1 Tax=Lysinibacillus xylanilyticus TaxID=582475 RepID=A0ABT4EPX4_9BACI|nr:DUF3784 domain-containing protein [Lysinibacillus xylanilyticus]